MKKSLKKYASRAVQSISKRISDDIPPQMTILNKVIAHSNAFLQSRLKLERCKLYKPHSGVHHPKMWLLINDVKQIFAVIQSEVALQKQVH